MKQIISECHWEITKRCNLSCIHCISASGNKNELDINKALIVVDKLSHLGCKRLYLTGGEPLSRKDIFHILEYAKSKKIRINLLTNGTLINNKNIKKIKLFVDQIGVSLDGASPKINDQIRGKGTFFKIVKAIEIIRKNNIPLSLYITINKINFYDLENILNLAKSWQIDSIRINEITLRGRAWKNRKYLALENRKRINLCDFLIEKMEKVFNFDKKDFIYSETCDFETSTVFLSSTGYLYPCIEIFQKKPNLHIGNIFDFKTKEYLKNSKSFFNLRKEKCVYQIIRGFNSSFCLNSSLAKECLCPLLLKLQSIKYNRRHINKTA